MRSFVDVILAFGTPAEFARLTGLNADYVRVLKSRDSIPSIYWTDVVQAAERAGLSEITYARLAALAARKRHQKAKSA